MKAADRFAFPQEILDTQNLPRMARVRLEFPSEPLPDIEATVHSEMVRCEIPQAIQPGNRIAIAVGSRGITGLDRLTREVVSAVRQAGGNPFIIPAMGSHGGAGADGQKKMLQTLGVTEKSVGAQIISRMDTVHIGNLPSGIPIYVDKEAAGADGIILINRIKPHTEFRGKIESGLMKMLTIGLGKHKGAASYHAEGFDRFHIIIPEAARMIMERVPVLGGLATVENADHQPQILRAVRPETLEEEEMKLLGRARELMPTLPFESLHLLMVDEIGKNISGTGMDPNVTGRFPTNSGVTGSVRPDIERIAVLDLTPETSGNATGTGLADVTTSRLFDKVDFSATYANTFTSAMLENSGIPVVVPDDRSALAAGLRGCKRIRPADARVVRIRNTLSLHLIMASEALLPELREMPEAEILSDAEPSAIDASGRLQPGL